jgi:hypothetical protein
MTPVILQSAFLRTFSNSMQSAFLRAFSTSSVTHSRRGYVRHGLPPFSACQLVDSGTFFGSDLVFLLRQMLPHFQLEQL